MLELITFVLSFGFILTAWGFEAALATFLGALALSAIAKPRYAWKLNWGAIIGILVIQILGICAVYSIWHEPAYTAVAAIFVVLAYIRVWIQ